MNSASTHFRCQESTFRFWLLLFLISGAELAIAEGKNLPFPSLYRNSEVFEAALAREKMPPPKGRQVTGITVPHHLLAIDLIAQGFYLASGRSYDRVIILSPDHFRSTRKPFATSSRDFKTVFGRVSTDVSAVGDLRKRCGLVEESDLFDREHGIQAILPFIAHFFPDTKLIPIVIRAHSDPQDWRELVEAMKPLVTEHTLVIQSTDFSHYLPETIANRRDQETMNVLATGRLEPLAELIQPDHLDAKAAQWIHLAIQNEVHQAGLTVVAHGNANQYAASPLEECTSYILQIFEKNAANQSPWPLRNGDSLYFFAGDTFFGRYFTHLAADPAHAEKVQEKILHLTGGAPLIVNLEGVLSSDSATLLDSRELVMPEKLTLDWLEKLNVVGVSLANNHAHDRGEKGFLHTRNVLEKHQFAVVGDGELHDFGRFKLAALTDLSNQSSPYTDRLAPGPIENALRGEHAAPVFCFLHWGQEWTALPGAREEDVTQFLFNAGTSAIIGSHPHTAGIGIEAFRGGKCARAYSLGNFLFDQRDPRASGGLVAVRFFETGTYALRWIPLRNLFADQSP